MERLQGRDEWERMDKVTGAARTQGQAGTGTAVLHRQCQGEVQEHRRVSVLFIISETNENVKTKLPEPPGLRDRLVQELQFFIVNVKEKSRNIGV